MHKYNHSPILIFSYADHTILFITDNIKKWEFLIKKTWYLDDGFLFLFSIFQSGF